MSSNRLKLNADKTQFIWLGSPQQLQIGYVQLTVDVTPCWPAFRDLGVTPDWKLSVKQHGDSIV